MFIDLKEVKVTPRDRERIEAILKTWMGVHAATVAVPHTQAGIEILLKYVKLEKEGRNRYPIIFRLYRKAANIRRELEEKKLYGARIN